MKPCSVEGCTNTLSAYNVTGMCGWHSVRAEKGLPLDPCSVTGSTANLAHAKTRGTGE